MNRRMCLVLLALVALVPTACRDQGPEDTPRIDLTVTGDLTTQVTGVPHWHTGSHPVSGVVFQMVIEGSGDFGLSWRRSGRPAEGTYPVTLNGADEVMFTQLSTQRFFLADSGEVRILRWVSDRVAEGSIEVSAFQYCPTPLRASACDRPSAAIPGAARVHISGTFVMTGSESPVIIMP